MISVTERQHGSRKSVSGLLMWPSVSNGTSFSGASEDYSGHMPCLPNATSQANCSPELAENVEQDAETSVTDIYQSWAPVIIFFCALTFVFNVFIVVAARWMRRPLTSTMFFSLSLAAADAVASLTVGLGLVFHR